MCVTQTQKYKLRLSSWRENRAIRNAYQQLVCGAQPELIEEHSTSKIKDMAFSAAYMAIVGAGQGIDPLLPNCKRGML